MSERLTHRFRHTLVFGEGNQRWSFPNPMSEALSKANRAARGYDGSVDTVSRQDALVLATFVSACLYLLVDCPTTERAIEQLRAIRNAVNESEEES
jgi:hypothetical protein